MVVNVGIWRAAVRRAFWFVAIAIGGVGIGAGSGCTEPAPSPGELRGPPGTPRAIEVPRGRPGARPVHFEAPPLEKNASDEFFASAKVPELRLRIEQPQMEKLRAEPRAYVRATLVENGKTTYADIGVKLKGAAGSFQGFDDRPALTLNMNKFRDGQTFHALDKFHLNNSVQDPTYACESICSELSRAAGVPATRAAHARVWINDRDLGLYVLKEGFDKAFLKRCFLRTEGNLYDGGFLQDVDADLEKDSGDGPNDFRDLRALSSACREANPQRRWALVQNHLDVDLFLRFMALELMTCHWDGYTKNRNNYRIYFDSRDGKARFLPHGMDQMFSDPGFSILDYPEPIVSSVVMQNPEWRKAYRKTVDQMLPLFSEEHLTKRLDAIRAKLQPVLAGISPDADREHADRCRELRERLVARAVNLREQAKRRDPGPVEFDERGELLVRDWEPRQETDDAQLEAEEKGERVELRIAAGPSGNCVASWRHKVLLAQGDYRLEGRVKTTGVTANKDEKGAGAGVRVSGDKRAQGVTGDADWTVVRHEFVVAEPMREVELVAELRGAGRATFEAPLRLVRLPKGK